MSRANGLARIHLAVGVTDYIIDQWAKALPVGGFVAEKRDDGPANEAGRYHHPSRRSSLSGRLIGLDIDQSAVGYRP